MILTKFHYAGLVACALLGAAVATAAPPVPDETPARDGEWGFRPFEGAVSTRNPPAFVWRPQKGALSYELEISPAGGAAPLTFANLDFNACCPTQVLANGAWTWRFRFIVAKGGVTSAWSRARAFAIDATAVRFPMPSREAMFARIPTSHPRLFVRPEQVSELRKLSAGSRADDFAALTARCERIVRKPPPSTEPPKYPADMERESDEWMKIWWGNRGYTIAVLDSAAVLAFTHMLGGRDEYAAVARDLLLAAAKWDPKGSTGFRYNDEAGMPFCYYFSRAYTFLYTRLSEDDRRLCRETMKARGDEMYRHLCPRQLWTPYESHANRGWHKLGEAAIAFFDEIPEARDWLWFAMNKQFCTYPVWNDDDGGWHEGSSYWSSYINRFSWWADVVRPATGVDVLQLPYFSKMGYYALYLMPPGAPGGGLGDLCDQRPGAGIGDLVGDFATLTGNGHWRWYADQAGTRDAAARLRKSGNFGYIDFVRGTRPVVTACPPTNLPSSIVFRGIGQAVLNTDLTASSNDVEVVFKSSPFGPSSHGYDAQNSFLMYAYGAQLFVPTGRRDQYGSAHHRDWMWETKSVNGITVNGKGQAKHTMSAGGRILGFHTSPSLDYVSGEAADAYEGRLTRATRHIAFVKPDLVIVYDQLAAPAPSTFEWRLHAPVEMAVTSQDDIVVTNGAAQCRAQFLWPQGLALSQTDKFDVPPRAKIKLRQWHLTASCTAPAARREFVTVLRPYRAGAPAPAPAVLDPKTGVVRAAIAGGTAEIRCRWTEGGDDVTVALRDAEGHALTEFGSSTAAIVPAPSVARVAAAAAKP